MNGVGWWIEFEFWIRLTLISLVHTVPMVISWLTVIHWTMKVSMCYNSLWFSCFTLDQHLRGHLHPFVLHFPTSPAALRRAAVILLHWADCRATSRTRPYDRMRHSPVCCLSPCFHYWPWITREWIHHNDTMLVGRASSLHSALGLRSFAPLVVVPPCVSVSVCIGCSQENKGFAGIIPLRQTRGCSKLGVAPSDTWSARNLGAAQRAGEGTAFV